MNTKHTPKPWKITGDKLCVALKNNKYISIMLGEFTKEEAEANARLIAAAPELLDVVQAYIDQGADEHAELDGHDPEHCNYCAALDALAKAEGREYAKNAL